MITLSNEGLVYRARYHPDLVTALKQQVPATARQWDGNRKVWLIAPAYGQVVANLHRQYFGEQLTVPQTATSTPVTEQRLVELRYLGTIKERSDGTRTAFGWCNGAWSLIFPEAVLRAWFDMPKRPDEEVTLYQTLGVERTADAATIKAAYRRLARQWHPDVCREPDATQVFQAIQHAYELLNDPERRARYDAGLQLVATLNGQQRQITSRMAWRPPLRCGLLVVTGYPQLKWFVVTAIHAWEDITDATGRVLTVSWPADADMFVETWL